MNETHTGMRGKTLTATVAAGVLLLIATLYWPVSQAGFVWVDKIIFHDAAWLRVGDDWRRFIFHGFYDWVNYFRPLVVGLFVVEVRLFDAQPGPMHLISLGIHLLNTLLVGMLATRLMPAPGATPRGQWRLGLAMLLYGLHPALIEPVVWISSQAELVTMLFTLLGLLASRTVRHPVARCAAISIFFFLAACCKESAIVFPPLLFLCDWMDEPHAAGPPSLQDFVRRHWRVYSCVVAAGIAYLLLRYWAMGAVVHRGSEVFFSFSRLQMACYTYLTYWQIIFWPMVGASPIHDIDASTFAQTSASLVATDLAAIALVVGGVYLACRRRPVGYLICLVSAALFPVLHLLPVAFDSNVYHERYAMTAIAMTSALIPGLVVNLTAARSRIIRALMGLALLVWLSLACLNIHTTLPLWSDEAKLWRWVLQQDPHSVTAMDHLLSTYIERDDRINANRVADTLLAEKPRCPLCMINIANLALSEGDAARAAIALSEAERTVQPKDGQRVLQAFVLATGQLMELRGDVTGAEEAYRDAISLDAYDPLAVMNLALLLARQARVDEARTALERALALFAPDEREVRTRIFEHALATARPSESH